MNVIKTVNNFYILELSRSEDGLSASFSDGKTRLVSECKYVDLAKAEPYLLSYERAILKSFREVGSASLAFDLFCKEIAPHTYMTQGYSRWLKSSGVPAIALPKK